MTKFENSFLPLGLGNEHATFISKYNFRNHSINEVISSNNRNIHCNETSFESIEIHFIITCSEILILLVLESMIIRNITRYSGS